MTVSNLPPDGSGGKRNPLPFTALGITYEHVGALYRSMKRELDRVRNSAKGGGSRTGDTFILAYETIELVADVVKACGEGLDVTDHGVSEAHIDAVKVLEKRERKSVERSRWHRTNRSPDDHSRLLDVIELLRAIVEAEDAA